jgi:hypothetical protein
MRNSSIAAVVAVVSLGLAGCGGGDDSPDVSTEVREAAEVLEDLGVDLDGASDLDGVLEGVDEFISSFGGEGGGTFIVGDVTYTMVADVCIVSDTDLVIDGPATGSDGSVAWASLNRSVETREEMAEFMDETMLEFMFPDGEDQIDDLSIEINVGATSRFDSADDQPTWSAGSSGFGFGDFDTLEYQVTGGTIRGEGRVEDYSGVAADYGDSVELKFEASCR